MAKPERKTFQQIVQEEASRSARKLETKARQASWIAKIQPDQSQPLYTVKHAALRQLFRIPTQTPIIRDAWSTSNGFLLSVRLRRTRSLLHVPLNELSVVTQQTQAAWIAQRARGRWWRKREHPQGAAYGKAASLLAGTAQ